ncbi:MAG: DUF4209 domain-containing protein [Holophagales bacterium]|nr:DUF4209 domain-containing protein [Holophagales bacterium]MYF93929.1 DUF4209 domain-containing protein [Holophagales bacterium]
MFHPRYPSDLVLTEADFTDCGWQDVLRSADPWAYSSISNAFRKAASDAEENDRRAKALWLLADACSMTFSPDRVEPFGPRFSSPGGSSFSPDELTANDTAFLASAVTSMESCVLGAHLLKARLADLVWLVQEPRSGKFALLAIDSYRAVPLNVETWLRDGLDCWQRVLVLARLTKVAAGKHGEEMEASVLQAFDSATEEHGFLAVKLAGLMRANGLGHDNALRVATRLESLGHAFAGQGEFHRGRSYLHEAQHWFMSLGDESHATATTAAEAECWIREAECRLSSADPSHGVAATFVEKAIQTYRTIPNKRRETHDVNERLEHLQARLRDFGKRAVDELTEKDGPGIDISHLVRRAREAVSGKGSIEALTALSNLVDWSNAHESRDRAIEILRKHPIPAMLFPAVTMNRDGRVVAKSPPAHLGDTLTKSDETAIRDRMLQEYGIHAALVTQGTILPALEVLRFEHRIREIEFIELASQAAIVPPGRSVLFGKALFAGYDGDFATALHLLSPQIENMVRFHLNRAGVETTHLDDKGIQVEKGLSSLLSLPRSSEVLGSDVKFELELLFTQPGGANLRNSVAHGLLSDAETAFGVYPIYAWWLTIKLVLSPFWNPVSSDTEETGE